MEDTKINEMDKERITGYVKEARPVDREWWGRGT